MVRAQHRSIPTTSLGLLHNATQAKTVGYKNSIEKSKRGGWGAPGGQGSLGGARAPSKSPHAFIRG